MISGIYFGYSINTYQKIVNVLDPYLYLCQHNIIFLKWDKIIEDSKTYVMKYARNRKTIGSL